MVRTTRAWVFSCLAVMLLPALAHAQARRLGATFSLGGTTVPVDAPDAAHDDVHNLFLQVAGRGFIEAHLVNSAGALISAFRVNVGGEYAQSPRVAFSPDVAGGGGYLVTWHTTLGNFTRVRGRLFRYDGVPVSGDIDIATAAVSGATGSNWTMGASVAYATGSREFLVAWMGGYTVTNDIHFQRVNSGGALLGSNVLVSPGTPDWERDPSVAYNPNLDEFYIAYAAYTESGRYGFVAGRRVKAGTGAFLGPQINYGAAVSTYVPAVTFNTSTQQYLLGWYNRSSGSAAVYGATLDTAGAIVGDVRVLSPFYSAYDALDLDYNPASGQSLLVTHGGGATPWEDAAVSILGTGIPYDNGFILTNTTDVRALRANAANNDGNFNPRLVASASEKKWLMVTSSLFAATHAQFATTDAVGGPPPPPPASSYPFMAIDVPASGSTVPASFAISGWASDIGDNSGNGVDVVHVWAFPVGGGAAVFLGAAPVGVDRPDVGAYLRATRFAASGFALTGSLAPGTYDVRISAFSTVSGGFNNSKVIRITVDAPRSFPRMNVEGPAQNQTITQTFDVGGWAVDLASTSGPGVEAVHVWAYPVGGGAPLWVGASSVGLFRPDVGNYFGATRFSSSGFYLRGTLPPGTYDLVAYAFNAITRTFNQTMVVRIRVV